jgi:hypothetical protein
MIACAGPALAPWPASSRPRWEPRYARTCCVLSVSASAPRRRRCDSKGIDHSACRRRR